MEKYRKPVMDVEMFMSDIVTASGCDFFDPTCGDLLPFMPAEFESGNFN